MAITLPSLPYEKNALEPHISGKTLEFHYGKHHNAYVVNTNKLIEGTDLANKDLEDIIRKTAGDASKIGIFNNAAQVWNHTFYWKCMKPSGGGKPRPAACCAASVLPITSRAPAVRPTRMSISASSPTARYR